MYFNLCLIWTLQDMNQDKTAGHDSVTLQHHTLYHILMGNYNMNTGVLWQTYQVTRTGRLGKLLALLMTRHSTVYYSEGKPQTAWWLHYWTWERLNIYVQTGSTSLWARKHRLTQLSVQCVAEGLLVVRNTIAALLG